MSTTRIGLLVLLGVFLMLAGIATAHNCDVITGDLPSPRNYSTTTGPTAGYVRYSFGTTSCNVGQEPMDWFGSTAEHPTILQNMYRYHGGRFEQIGMAWVKHGFCALQQSICGTCSPFCGGCCSQLGVGCSDPYDASLNGGPEGLGPRSQINPATGRVMVWPYPRPASLSLTSNNNGQLHVKADDMNPALNVGAIYLVEGQYLSADEGSGHAGNRHNNASYRRANVSAANGFPISFSGAFPTQREKPAILGWKDLDPEVRLSYIDIPGDGRMILASRVTSNGSGTWHYEYALFNLNSDRAGQSFHVPISRCNVISQVGFHDVDYHSGDGHVIGINFDGTDWPSQRSESTLSWSTETAAQNPNANALRYSTMYNFRFDSNAPPEAGEIAIGLYKSGPIGSPDQMSAAAMIPSAVAPPACPADANRDNSVGVPDLLLIIGQWGAGGGPGDVHPPCGDNVVGVPDLLAVIGTWGDCPR